jgi:hypothetical protein
MGQYITVIPGAMQISFVMAGLDPAIHVLLLQSET